MYPWKRGKYLFKLRKLTRTLKIPSYNSSVPYTLVCRHGTFSHLSLFSLQYFSCFSLVAELNWRHLISLSTLSFSMLSFFFFFFPWDWNPVTLRRRLSYLLSGACHVLSCILLSVLLLILTAHPIPVLKDVGFSSSKHTSTFRKYCVN